MIRSTVQAKIKVDNPDEDSGFTTVTVGEWLILQMKIMNIPNKELFYRLRERGYLISKPNIVSMWRKDGSKLPLERLPVICDALGLGEREKNNWIYEIFCAYFPTLEANFKDPIRERVDSIKAGMKAYARGRKDLITVVPVSGTIH